MEGTPAMRKYPQRNRKKVTYNDEFELSLEENPKRKQAKVEESYTDEGEKENEQISEIIEEDDTEEVCEYEKMRLKNVEENKRIMMELGLLDPKKDQKNRPKPTKPVPKRRNNLHKEVQNPTKRSLRLLKKTPEGKNIPLDIFQETPHDSPTTPEIKTRIEEEELPMFEDDANTDFLDCLKASLSQESAKSENVTTDDLITDMRNLTFAAIEKVTKSRVQSMCVHPLESQLLVAVGSKDGELGLWNVNEGKVARFNPHLRAINCISASADDQSKLFTTSFDGTIRRADINKSMFDLVYQTDEKSGMCHITWHTQVNSNTLLVAHGTGDIGVVDLRTKGAQQWFHCHPRSIRTIQLHPTQPHYFLTASGIGESKIWDLRGNKKHMDEFVGELKSCRGLTSAFFSPDGNRVVSTCNDDFLRIYDSSDLTNPKELHKVMHDNHTGRWLSVFKAVWHPHSSDLIFVGSMLQPRRIQMYNNSGRLMKEIKDENLTTVVPVIAFHPTQPIITGGNSSGKAHVFTTPSLFPQFVKPEENSF